jgi:hypothetical protein
MRRKRNPESKAAKWHRKPALISSSTEKMKEKEKNWRNNDENESVNNESNRKSMSMKENEIRG